MATQPPVVKRSWRTRALDWCARNFRLGWWLTFWLTLNWLLDILQLLH